MKAFYTELDKGIPKAQALQTAKKTYLKTAPNAQSHPYYWANFVVIGDDEPITDGGKIWWFVMGILLIGGFLGYRFTNLSKG